MRRASLDALRGLVMVIMALDHARDFLSSSGRLPEFAQVTDGLFLTRWITHLCAPSFVFLAGVSAWFYGKKNPKQLTHFLVTRGLWIIFLDFTVIRWAWAFDLTYSRHFLGVLWALGVSMICLAGVARLPTRAIAAISFAIILGHNALDGVHFEFSQPLNWLWRILHDGGALYQSDHHLVIALYPVIPWPAVMALGYLFARVWSETPARQSARPLVIAGAGSLAAFVLLRSLNLYGDPTPWLPQAGAFRTFLAFLNCQKYPPSLDYLLMTLGLSLLFWAAIERFPRLQLKPLVAFGQVPQFYYIVHLYFLHALGWIAGWIAFGSEPGFSFPNFPSSQLGFGLGTVYLLWAAAVAALYFPCRWYADVKKRSKNPLLSYI